MKDFPRIGDMVIISEKYTDTEDFREHYCYSDEAKAGFLGMVGKPVRVVGVGEWAYPHGESSNRCDLSDGSGRINTVQLEFVEPVSIVKGDGPDTNVRPPEDDELMETIRVTAKACGMSVEEYIKKLCMPYDFFSSTDRKPSEKVSFTFTSDRNLDAAILFFIENGYAVHLDRRDPYAMFRERTLTIERRDT